MPTQPDRSAPEPRALTYWHCERCNVTGSMAHDAHAGVWEVYTLLMDAHYAVHADCEERYYIRVSKEPLAAASARDAARGDV